jgi:[protein-PII] uridylyltransferase
MCARMGLDEHDTAVITAMIRWHLLLPDTAFRYDITDPSTWRRVREHVPDTETLELLLYLALADQKATGPSVATEWREQLLRQLVAHVSAGVETEEAIPEPSIDQQEVLGVPGVVVTSRPEADGLLVTVGAPDRVGLLSIVAGVLAAHRLEIRSARVVTVGDSAAQDWHVRPFFGDAPDPGLIAEDIRRVLEGSSHLDDWLARRSTPERRADAAPPRVLISHSPDTHTRLEIRAHDEPGLLHRVARIISEHGSVIRGAIVTTAGSEVVDSFFVVDASGRPLEPGQAQLLADAITSGLRAPPASASA